MHSNVLIVVARLSVHECAYYCTTATGTEGSSVNRTFSYESACTADPKCFQHYWDETDTPAALTSHVSRLQPPQLAELASSLGVVHSNEQGVGFGEGFLVHMLVRRYQRREEQHEAIGSLPFYPEDVVPWESPQLPELDHTDDSCLALPKLNLQVSPAHLMTLALLLSPSPSPSAGGRRPGSGAAAAPSSGARLTLAVPWIPRTSPPAPLDLSQGPCRQQPERHRAVAARESR